jgi:hypothetical protein
MTKRRVVYVVVALDVLYIAALAACAFLIGHLHPPDFAAMRNKIEASSSLENLALALCMLSQLLNLPTKPLGTYTRSPFAWWRSALHWRL